MTGINNDVIKKNRSSSYYYFMMRISLFSLENANALEGYPDISSILGDPARALRAKLRFLDSAH